MYPAFYVLFGYFGMCVLLGLTAMVTQCLGVRRARATISDRSSTFEQHVEAHRQLWRWAHGYAEHMPDQYGVAEARRTFAGTARRMVMLNTCATAQSHTPERVSIV